MSQSQDLGWTFDGFDVGTLGELASHNDMTIAKCVVSSIPFTCALIRICCLLELAGKKELESYSQFLEEYSTQLRCIENALDEYFEEAWDFNLDPVALQVRLILAHRCRTNMYYLDGTN